MYNKTFVYGRFGDSKNIRKSQIKKGFVTEADCVLPKKIGILTFIVQDRRSSSSYKAGDWKYTTTKKGKKDIKFVTIDVEPNVSVLVNYVAKKLVENTKFHINIPVKKINKYSNHLNSIVMIWG